MCGKLNSSPGAVGAAPINKKNNYNTIENHIIMKKGNTVSEEEYEYIRETPLSAKEIAKLGFAAQYANKLLKLRPDAVERNTALAFLRANSNYKKSAKKCEELEDKLDELDAKLGGRAWIESTLYNELLEKLIDAEVRRSRYINKVLAAVNDLFTLD